MNKKVEEALTRMKPNKPMLSKTRPEYFDSNTVYILQSQDWNIIKQAFSDMEEEITLLRKTNLALDKLYNSILNIGQGLTTEKFKLQSKLDKIEKVVNNVFKEYTQSNGKYSFSGNDLLEIKSILDKEE